MTARFRPSKGSPQRTVEQHGARTLRRADDLHDRHLGRESAKQVHVVDSARDRNWFAVEANALRRDRIVHERGSAGVDHRRPSSRRPNQMDEVSSHDFAHGARSRCAAAKVAGRSAVSPPPKRRRAHAGDGVDLRASPVALARRQRQRACVRRSRQAPWHAPGLRTLDSACEKSGESRAGVRVDPRFPSRRQVGALACGAADKRPGTRQGLGGSILPVKIQWIHRSQC
jgi:hypothetical protein